MVFIRKNRNRSGSYSIQIVSKQRGSYKVLKTLGSGRSEPEIEFLYQRAQQELEKMDGSISMFVNRDDAKLEVFSLINTSSFASSRLTNMEMEPSIFSNSCCAR